MEAKTIEFLKNLQLELNTQETDCQANPRFWVVAQHEWQPCWREQFDAYHYTNGEGDYFDTFEEFKGYLLEYGYIDQEVYDEADCLEDLPNYYEYDQIPMKKIHVIKQNTMFLTKRECQEHIKRNKHHYNDTVHTYAMTAWRSPQVEKLIKILQTENFDEVK